MILIRKTKLFLFTGSTFKKNVIMKKFIILSVVASFAVFSLTAQTTKPLHKYIIEREIPHAGDMSAAQLDEVANKSCKAINKITEKVQWVESYVTENKVYCVYLAENEAAIREHARVAGFPVSKISEVKVILDPTAAK